MHFLSSLDSLDAIDDTSVAPFGADVAHLVFQAAEPGDDQRWSTWPATLPSERGPQPRPDWLVTSAAAIDTELGVVKTGKEADLHLIERAIPDAPSSVSRASASNSALAHCTRATARPKVDRLSTARWSRLRRVPRPSV